MIQSSVIKKLQGYNDSSFQILSVYLGSDTQQSPTGEFLLTQFHSLLHQNLSKEKRADFVEDIARIEKYLSEYIPSARSLIFFSAGEQLWEVAELEYALMPSLTVGPSPNLRPVQRSLHHYSKYLVVLVDREKAKMFTVDQGEIARQAELKDGDVPPRAEMTGRDGVISQTDTNFRRNELYLQRHIDMIAKQIAEFAKDDDIQFVLIGGHREMFRKIEESLPMNLREKVAGDFVTELNIPLNDIFLKSKELAAEIASESR